MADDNPFGKGPQAADANPFGAGGGDLLSKPMPSSADLVKSGDLKDKSDIYSKGVVATVPPPLPDRAIPAAIGFAAGGPVGAIAAGAGAEAYGAASHAIGQGAEKAADYLVPGQKFVKAGPTEEVLNTTPFALGAPKAGLRGGAGVPSEPAPGTTIPRGPTPPSAGSAGPWPALKPGEDPFGKPQKPATISGPFGTRDPVELPEATDEQWSSFKPNKYTDTSMRQLGPPAEDLPPSYREPTNTTWYQGVRPGSASESAHWTSSQEKAKMYARGGEVRTVNEKQFHPDDIAKINWWRNTAGGTPEEFLASKAPKDLGAARAPKPTGPVKRADVDAIDLDHYQRQGQRQADLQEANASTQTAMAKHLEMRDPTTVNALLAHAQGDPDALPLTPAQQTIFDEVHAPLQSEVYDLYKDRTAMARMEKYSDEEVDAMQKEFDPNYLSRIPERYAERELGLGQDDMDPVSGPSKARGETRPIDNSSLQQRRYHAIQDKQGNRAIVYMNDKKEFSLVRPDDPHDRAIFEGDWETKGAIIREIEEATKGNETPEKYIKDPLVAMQITKLRLKRSINEMARTREKKAEMVERGWATTDSKVARNKGWRPTAFPGMKGLFIEPRLVAALDRWGGTKTDGGGLLEGAINANQYITRSMFGIPIPHILNVGVGFLTDLHLSSPKNFLKAIQDMQGRNNGFYRLVQEHGGALWTGGSRAQEVWPHFEEMIRVMSGEVKAPKGLAGKAAAPVKAWWKKSHDAMAYAQDLMLLTQIHDYMQKGPLHKAMGIDDAVRQAHKAIPPYRIPTEVPHPELGNKVAKLSRAPSAFTEDPLGKAINNFARYHYFTIQQSMAPLVATFKAAEAAARGIGGDKEGALRAGFDAQRALKQTVLLGVAMAYVMPWIDKNYIKKWTGDERAMMTRHGAMAIVQSALDVIHGKAPSWEQLALGGISLSPVATMFAEVVKHYTLPEKNYGKAAVAAGSTSETFAQMIGKLLNDVPIYTQIRGALPQGVRGVLEGKTPKEKNWPEALLPLGPGLTHEPYSTEPPAKKPRRE